MEVKKILIAKLRIQNIVVLIFCLYALSGCSNSQDNEELLDAFLAEYWDSDDFEYHEDSDFTYRDEKISMIEYEELRKEILGW